MVYCTRISTENAEYIRNENDLCKVHEVEHHFSKTN